jgi:hypothetical protein
MWLFQDTCYTCSTRLFHMCPRCVAHVALYVAQTLVPIGCEVGFSYNPNEHITYHFMWLFDSKLNETFPGINIDSSWCETYEDTLITHPSIYLSIEPICKQGCKSKFRLWFISIGLTLASSPPLIYHVWALTHYLISDKHLGCYMSIPKLTCMRACPYWPFLLEISWKTYDKWDYRYIARRMWGVLHLIVR